MSRSPQDLIAELGRKLGLPQLAWDAHAQCAVVFDDDLQAELHYAHSDGLIHLAAEVGRLPADAPLGLLRSMAFANLDPGNLGRCHLALDRDAVLLGRSLPAPGLESDALIEALRQMVLTVRTWRSCLVDPLAGAAGQ